MKVFDDKGKEKKIEGGLHTMHKHTAPMMHIPPHDKKALIRLEYDESDWRILSAVFGDEDTAFAAAEIIRDAPPEIQILAIQLMNIIKEEV